MNRQFYVYIITNPTKKVLYTGITNDLIRRLTEHYNEKGITKTFAGRYFCYNLLYFEKHHTSIGAIEREKEIKDWNRKKKEALINIDNPNWLFLNEEIMEWPPHKI